MLKKRLYTALSILLCCITAEGVRAQANILLPASNITGQTDYNVIANNGSATAIGIGGTIKVSSNTANIPATSTGTTSPLPLSVVYIKANTINSLAIGGASEAILSQTPGTIFTALLSLSGALTCNYRIATVGNAWLAGVYSTPTTFTSNTAPTQQLTITVPAVLSLNTPVAATSTLGTISTLAPFRTGGGISLVNSFDYFSTVPTLVSLKASSDFTFTTTQLFNSTPVVSANQLSGLMSGTYAGAAINVSSSTDQLLSLSTGVPVILTNKNAITNTLSISAANLKNSFAQAGTYTLPLVYTAAKTSSAYPTTLTSITTNTSAQLTVGKISELTIPSSTTANLNFTTAAAYNQGVTAALSNPVTVSSTMPYNVTVKASGDFISGANSIPVGVAILEATPAQTGTISPIVLSTATQALISGANPVIDRPINLQVRIPSTQTSNLLAKPAGTYTTTVTFTIVAP